MYNVRNNTARAAKAEAKNVEPDPWRIMVKQKPENVSVERNRKKLNDFAVIENSATASFVYTANVYGLHFSETRKNICTCLQEMPRRRVPESERNCHGFAEQRESATVGDNVSSASDAKNFRKCKNRVCELIAVEHGLLS